MPERLERLVSAHQLITYPSEYARFNRAYDEALRLLENNTRVDELYVMQYRDRTTELCFCSVPVQMISPKGPYRLTDICAAVRRPRLILHADCSTCGPVSESESDAALISQAALSHVSQTGHVVVLNGTVDIPE